MVELAYSARPLVTLECMRVGYETLSHFRRCAKRQATKLGHDTIIVKIVSK